MSDWHLSIQYAVLLRQWRTLLITNKLNVIWYLISKWTTSHVKPNLLLGAYHCHPGQYHILIRCLTQQCLHCISHYSSQQWKHDSLKTWKLFLKYDAWSFFESLLWVSHNTLHCDLHQSACLPEKPSKQGSLPCFNDCQSCSKFPLVGAIVC
jgi:hypothetical protein